MSEEPLVEMNWVRGDNIRMTVICRESISEDELTSMFSQYGKVVAFKFFE